MMDWRARLKSFLLVSLFISRVVVSAAAVQAVTGVRLNGDFASLKPALDCPVAGPRMAVRTAEDGNPVLSAPAALANLPVIGKGLAQRLENSRDDTLMPVIVYLAYQPQERVAQTVKGKYAGEKRAISEKVKKIWDSYAGFREPTTAVDGVNGKWEARASAAAGKLTLQELNHENEALSLTFNRELAAALAKVLAPSQEEVKKVVQKNGGTVISTLTAVNALIVMVPGKAVKKLAELKDVRRLVEDEKLKADLENAAAALLIAAPENGGSLWNQGFSGGSYDAAVLDTGADLTHPALADDSYRSNFFACQLDAAAAGEDWDDVCSVDDLQGHGTHVLGIVASYGAAGTYADSLGMAHGAERTVTLKAGFRCRDGGGAMYISDAMTLIDRALLRPETELWSVAGEGFADDIDGINLSFGSETAVDETDFSRFWDALVSSFDDLVVTVSAGNEGPGNLFFGSPACNYNAITVASIDDKNTATREDDNVSLFSSRGPTAGGRRKPDLAVPGSAILSCNHDWESGADFVNKWGTSMAAPMVLGVAMDLMEAGVYDELEIKALLLNTAQKNCPGIDFEDDSDGWSPACGWGYLNTWAACYHRSDVRTLTVQARPVDSAYDGGWYRLLKGQMRDEAVAGDAGLDPGEGRDRVTMVWNRHADYNPEACPFTSYSLSDLNLCLYQESNGNLLSADLNAIDNVHQVRIPADFEYTGVVVRAYAWDTEFSHGGASESFALATEENFVEVDFPQSFNGVGAWPEVLEPGEEGSFKFWLINDSELACHNNSFTPLLPPGWTLVAGPPVFAVGSIAGGGASSEPVVWRLQAPASTGSTIFKVRHNHESYALVGPSFDWHMGVDIAWDGEAPTPDPMSFAVAPAALANGALQMTATTAHDLHAVEYEFCRSDGYSSGWLNSVEFVDGGLAPDTLYGYRVRARDTARARNVTGLSALVTVWTAARPPGECLVDEVTACALTVTPAANGNASDTECVLRLYDSSAGLYFYLDESGGRGDIPVWRTFAQWGSVTVAGLTSDSTFLLDCRARNHAGLETISSAPVCVRTRTFDSDIDNDGDVDGSDLVLLAKDPCAAACLGGFSASFAR
ncbi:MAG: S8 family serine peptidase [Deltaproteobacteria bacterium]|nr:S8 family serine peptidase [Deltaproteobacteria bacterium]